MIDLSGSVLQSKRDVVKEVVVRWTEPCLYFARQPRLATILYRVRFISADSEANGQCEEYGDNRCHFQCGLTIFDREHAVFHCRTTAA